MSTLDSIIIVAYLVGCMAIGLLFRGKVSNSKEFFTAGGGLGSTFGVILVGLSIASAYFSGITFVAYPSVIYTNGLALLFGTLLVCMPVTFVLLRYWFLPRYLAAKCESPYDIVERQFGSATRTLAASLFVLMRIGWMAATIYAPTLVIMTMGRLGPEWFWPLVLAQGLSSTVYTVFAGVRGVIITDAIQMTVIALGVLVTIGFAFALLPVSKVDALHQLHDAGRLLNVDTSFRLTGGLTIWAVMIGVTFANVANYVGDQMALQRYLATGSAKAAGQSFVVNLIGIVTVLLLLTVIGLALSAYYLNVADPSLPLRPDGSVAGDSVFPHFVATKLPIGLAGLIAAAIMAASSLTPGINTLAGVITLDFRARLGPPMTDRQQIRFAKITSLLVGLSATLVTGLVSQLGELYDLTQIILGVFAGPLLACVGLATSGLRVRGGAMLTAIIVGCTVGVTVSLGTPITSLWVCPITCLTTVGIALLGRLINPSPDQRLVAAKDPESTGPEAASIVEPASII